MAVRARLAWVLAIVTGVLAAGLLWAILAEVNLPVVCGIGPAAWWPTVETLAFAPTIWVTRPLDEALRAHDLYRTVTAASVIEVLVLAGLYAWLVLHVVRGDLLARALELWRRRRAWILTGLALTIATSVAARHEAARDGGREEPPRLSVVEVSGQSGASSAGSIAVVSQATLRLDAFKFYLAPRGGDAPWVVTASGGIFELTGDRLVEESSGAGPSSPGSSGDSPPVLFAYPDTIGGFVQLLGPLTSAARHIRLETAAQSVRAHAIGGRILLTGMGFWSEDEVPAAAFLRLAPKSRGGRFAAGVMVVDPTSRSPGVVALAGPTGDHGSANLDSVVAADGKLHLLAAVVRVDAGNSTRIQHLVFDPSRDSWASHELLHSRSHFTGSAEARLLRSAGGLDAFWSYDAGNNHFADDGLYAARLGETRAYHLESRPCAVAVAAIAEDGSVLVAAVPRGAHETVWFRRRGDDWQRLGVTPLPPEVALYNDDPLAIWSEGGSVRAAFRHRVGLLVQTLVLASEGGSAVAAAVHEDGGEPPRDAGTPRVRS